MIADPRAPAGSRFCALPDMLLDCGAILPAPVLAYETWGRLSPTGDNAILVAHGFTSSAHAAAGEPGEGWWDGLIGPGKAIDTDRHFVVASNMLGSCWGSTGPTSIDPRTGRPYGPDFPLVSTRDMVRAQRGMLDSLGVTRLVAVAGPSFGGILAFQWAVEFPDFMAGIIPVVGAPRTPPSALEQVGSSVLRFWSDPNWRGGRYAEHGGMGATMVSLWADTLRLYGLKEVLEARIPDPAAREPALLAAAEAGRHFDANAFIRLGLAASHFDVEPLFPVMRAKVLYSLCPSDRVFPATLAPEVMAKLAAAGVDARYFELESDFGHLAFREDAAKLAAPMAEFLRGLAG